MMNEQISAWIDGELSESEARRVHDVVARQAAMQGQCGTLWLIGDVMRNESMLPTDFTERVMAALNEEPTVLAPVLVLPQRIDHASNSRWMPLAAAVAGIAVVAWVALSGTTARQIAAPVVANASPLSEQIALKAGVRQVEDDRPYLMAHQAYGPGVQMAGVSGYVRPVVLDEPMASR